MAAAWASMSSIACRRLSRGILDRSTAAVFPMMKSSRLSPVLAALEIPARAAASVVAPAAAAL